MNDPIAFRMTEAGLLPVDWDVVALGDVAARIKNGLVHSGASKRGLPLTRIETISSGVIDRVRTGTVQPSSQTGPYRVERNDILYSHINSIDHIGKVAVKHDDLDLIHGMNLLLIRVNNLADPGYMYYVLTSDQARRRARILAKQAVSQASINISELKGLMIPFPPLVEQRAIAKALSDMDALIAALDALIVKKHAVKTAVMQQLLTGSQRLPGFSGEWASISLGSRATLKARIGWQGLTTGEYRDNGEYYLVTGTDFDTGQINWSSCHFVDKSRYIQDSNIQISEGDVLITKDGTIGKVGYVDLLPGPATLNSGVFVIRPRDGAFDSHYLYYVLTSNIFDAFLSKLQAGSTISHLYQKDFVHFRFDAPGLEEQASIALVLSDMDADIAALKARRDKTRHIKTGMMQELLTGRSRLAPTGPVPARPSE